MVIWTGQLLSRVGNGISAFSLGVYLFQKTGSTTAYSMLLLCAFLPSILLAPIGGVIADKKDRKLMMIIGDTGGCLGILLITLMFLYDSQNYGFIYLGIIISSLFGALHSPAFKAAITDLLDEKEYSKASGLVQLAEASRYLLAPVIAGFLMSRIDIATILVIDMITFISAVVTTYFIKLITRQPTSEINFLGFWKEFIQGVEYIAGNKKIFQLLLLLSIVTFFTGILQSLFAPVILSFGNAQTLGIIQSISGTGMVISSLLIGFLSKTDKQRKPLFFSLLTISLFYILIGTSTSIVLITIYTFCLFSCLPFVNTSLDVLFRKTIDNEVQGRIWSLISLSSQLGMLMAFAISGFLAEKIFNPLLIKNGPLANSIGKMIGTGASRGSGLMIIISGLLLLILTILFSPRIFPKGHIHFTTTITDFGSK